VREFKEELEQLLTVKESRKGTKGS
jgi:hypothetical protein